MCGGGRLACCDALFAVMLYSRCRNKCALGALAGGCGQGNAEPGSGARPRGRVGCIKGLSCTLRRESYLPEKALQKERRNGLALVVMDVECRESSTLVALRHEKRSAM